MSLLPNPMSSTSQMRFIAMKRLCRERSIVFWGIWDGGALHCGDIWRVGLHLLVLGFEDCYWASSIQLGVCRIQ